MSAAEHGYVDVVKLLLAAGADPLRRGFDGLTALDIARENAQAEIVELLEQAIHTRADRADHRQSDS